MAGSGGVGVVSETCPVCGVWQPHGPQTYMFIDHIETCSKLPSGRNKWLFAVNVAHVRDNDNLDSAIVDGRKSSCTKVRGMSRRTVKLDPFAWTKICSQPPAMIEDADQLKKLLIKYVKNSGVFVYDVSLLRREWLIKLGTKYRCPNGRLINGNRISTTPKSTFSDMHWKEALRMDQSKKGFEIEDDIKEIFVELEERYLGGRIGSGVPYLEQCVCCGCSMTNSVASLCHVYQHFKHAAQNPLKYPQWVISFDDVSQSDRFIGQAYQFPTAYFFRNPLEPNSNIYFRDLDYLGCFLCILYGTTTETNVSLARKDRLYLLFVDEDVRMFIYNNGRDAFSNLARHEPRLMSDLQQLYPEFGNKPFSLINNPHPHDIVNNSSSEVAHGEVAISNTSVSTMIAGNPAKTPTSNQWDSDGESWDSVSPRTQDIIEETVIDVQGQVNRSTFRALLRLLTRTFTPDQVADIVRHQMDQQPELRTWLLTRLEDIKARMEKSYKLPKKHGHTGHGMVHSRYGIRPGVEKSISPNREEQHLSSISGGDKIDFGAFADVDAFTQAHTGFGLQSDRLVHPDQVQTFDMGMQQPRQQHHHRQQQQQQQTIHPPEDPSMTIYRSFGNEPCLQPCDTHFPRDSQSIKFPGHNTISPRVDPSSGVLNDRPKIAENIAPIQIGSDEIPWVSPNHNRGLGVKSPMKPQVEHSPESHQVHYYHMLNNHNINNVKREEGGAAKFTLQHAQRRQKMLPYNNPNWLSGCTTANSSPTAYSLDIQSQHTPHASPNTELARLQARHLSTDNTTGRAMAAPLLVNANGCRTGQLGAPSNISHQ